MDGLKLLWEEGFWILWILGVRLIRGCTVLTGDFNFPFPITGRANLHDKTASAASRARFPITVCFGIAVALGAGF